MKKYGYIIYEDEFQLAYEYITANKRREADKKMKAYMENRFSFKYDYCISIKDEK